MEYEKHGANGAIESTADFDGAPGLGEKLGVLGHIMGDGDRGNFKTQLHADALILFQDVMHSIGIPPDEARRHATRYPNRQEPGYDGFSPLPRGRVRRPNIDMLNLALGAIDGAKFYSPVIQGEVEMDKTPNPKETLRREPKGWGLVAELG